MANYVKFLRGTPQAYANLAAKGYDDDTLYFISEKDDKDGSLYLGSKLIAGGECEKLSLSDLSGVAIENLANKQILYYDATAEAWINADYKDLIHDFVGATEESSGVSGLVPAPEQNKTNLFLRSDGKWAEIEATGPSIAYDAESPISISADGVISLMRDDTILGLVDDSLTIVGYNEAEAGTVLAKTADGIEWIVPTDSRVDELAAALEELIAKVSALEATVGKAAQYDEAGELVSEASGLVADVSKLNSDVSDIKEDISDINTELSDLDTDLQTLTSTVGTLGETVEAIDTDLTTLEGAVSTVEGDVSTLKTQVADLESTKADADAVYTKEETVSEINKAVAAADHLKRTVVVSTEMIDVDMPGAEQYIYMVPNADGNYDEYMVIEGEIEKVGDWKVDLSDYATKEELQNQVDDLTEEIDKKADIVYYPVKNEETGETTQVPGAFLSPEDKEKLSALVVGEGGNVEISGKVNADNVEGLGTWITENGNTYISGLTENNLGSSILDKLNFITSVDTNKFSVTDGKLELKKLAVSDVADLETILNSKASTSDLTAVAGDLATLSTKVEGLETTISSLDDIYVTKTVFNSTVGDLEALINQNKTDITNLETQVNILDGHLTWGTIEE